MTELINNNHLKMNTNKELSAIRDNFAGLALQALLADPRRSGSDTEFAEYAYCLADVMMEVRNK